MGSHYEVQSVWFGMEWPSIRVGWHISVRILSLQVHVHCSNLLNRQFWWMLVAHDANFATWQPETKKFLKFVRGAGSLNRLLSISQFTRRVRSWTSSVRHPGNWHRKSVVPTFFDIGCLEDLLKESLNLNYRWVIPIA